MAVIGVVGAGAMGAGIAEVAARAGAAVRLFDVDEAAIERGMAALRASLQRAAERGKLTGVEAAAAIERVRPTVDLTSFADCEVAIEAITEKLDLKQRLFQSLDELCPPPALLASNTSSLSITEIAAAATRPDRVIGLHFFNPAPVMQLVEVVRGHQSSADALERGRRLAEEFGKRPVVTWDSPGFIVNRVARPFYLEGLRLVGDRYADVATVDAAARSAGFRMGPFELIDLVGCDVNFAVSSTMYERTYHEPRFRPHLLQETLVRAGQLGRKTGRGFYDYTTSPPQPSPLPGVAAAESSGELLAPPPGPWHEWAATPRTGFVTGRIVAALINESYWAVGQGVATRADLDVAMKLGTSWPRGPFEWAAEVGLDLVLRTLDALAANLGPAYLPSPLLCQDASSAPRPA